jgi:hypothetical protein
VKCARVFCWATVASYEDRQTQTECTYASGSDNIAKTIPVRCARAFYRRPYLGALLRELALMSGTDFPPYTKQFIKQNRGKSVPEIPIYIL